jgi:hypothetical protein
MGRAEHALAAFRTLAGVFVSTMCTGCAVTPAVVAPPGTVDFDSTIRSASAAEGRGDLDDALVLYARCVDRCVREGPTAGAWATYLPAKLESLALRHRPAADYVRQLQAKLEAKSARAGLPDDEIVMLAGINRSLGANEQNEKLFARADPRQRLIMWPYVHDVWLRARSYASIFAHLVTARASFDSSMRTSRDLVAAREKGILAEGDVAAGVGDTIEEGAELIEVLVGVGRFDLADEVLEIVLGLDGSPQAWHTVLEHVRAARLGAEKRYFDRAKARLSAADLELLESLRQAERHPGD